MKTKATALLAISLLCLVVFSAAQTAEELIAQGDELFHAMKDMPTAEKIRSLYMNAANLTDNKYEAFWRIARVDYYIGTHTEKKGDKKTIFAQGVYWAEKAVELEPEKPDGHYWLAVNNGKFGEVKGVLKSLSLVKPIKNALNKVIEIDRTYEDGGADRVMGRVYFKLPGFAGGSKDKSREHLEKSKELGPNDPVTRLYLAETLLKFDEVERAREELQFVLDLPDDGLWEMGIAQCQADAKELLKDKKFRK